MRKKFWLILSLLLAIVLSGCGNDGPIVLPDDQGKDVSFENMKEPALVFFFTGNTWDYCKSQLVELQNKKELFSDFPGKVYAVSVASVKDHKDLKEELGLDYPLVSDEDLVLIRKVEMVDQNAPKSLRGFAVLDKAGNVLHHEVVDPFGDNAEAIIQFAAEKISSQK